MKFCIAIIILFITVRGFSQQLSEDQKKAIETNNALITAPDSHDTTVALAYIGLSEILYVSNLDTMDYLCRKAIKVCDDGLKNTNNKLVKDRLLMLKSSANNNIGFVHYNKGEIEKALEKFSASASLQAELGNHREHAASLINVGMISFNTGDYETALQNLHKAVKIQEANKIEEDLGTGYNNLGFVYESNEDYNKAMEYFTKAKDIRSKVGDMRGLAESYHNIASIYSTKGEIDTAIAYNLKALELRKSIADKMGTAQTSNNLALIYQNIAANKYNQNLDSAQIREYNQLAFAYYDTSLNLFREVNDLQGVSKVMKNFGLICYNLGYYDLADEYGNESLRIAEELGYVKDIMNSSELLSMVYEQKGNGLQALDMFKKYIIMRDSINGESNRKAIAQQQAKYEYERKKSEDDAAREQERLKDEQAQKQKDLIIKVIIGGALLLGGFLIFSINRLQITRKQKKEIEYQKGLTEKQKEEIELQHVQLEETHKEIKDSINYAKRIQTAILPPNNMVRALLPNSFVLYQPKDIVAGDFYWMEQVGSKTLFAAADCTGHGVPGAMVSVICNNGLNRSVREYGLNDPGKILDKTREIVIQEFEKSEEEVKDGMDIALCSLSFSQEQKQNVKGSNAHSPSDDITRTVSNSHVLLEYAGAHNPLWIVRNGSDSVEEIKANKQPIGKYDEPLPYKSHTIELNPGDSFYIFSDGYADQFGGEKGKKLKSSNFKKLLLSIQDKSMDEQHDILNKSFLEWRGDIEQLDDVCVIGVKV